MAKNQSTYDNWGDTFKGLLLDNQELAVLPIVLILGFLVGSVLLLKAKKEERSRRQREPEGSEALE